MLSMTETAGEHLAALLEGAGAPAEMAVRLVREESGLSLTVDSERPGDATFTHAGRTVLVLDGEVSNQLAESTLDVEETEDGPKLGLK